MRRLVDQPLPGRPLAQVIRTGNGASQVRYRCDGCGVWARWGEGWVWWCDGGSPDRVRYADPEPAFWACSMACGERRRVAEGIDKPPVTLG